MGDMGDYFRDWDAYKKRQREANISAFDPAGWTKHTNYHFSRIVANNRLDYWPSKRKWQYKGKVQTGNVLQFIKAREKEKTDGHF